MRCLFLSASQRESFNEIDLLVIGVQVNDAQTAEAKLRDGFEEELPIMLQRKAHEVRAQLVTCTRNQRKRINVV